MATAKKARRLPVPVDNQVQAKLSDLRADIEYANLDNGALIELNRWLVTKIRSAQTAARSKAAVDIQPGMRVRFASRKYGVPITITVESVGRTGILKGTTETGVAWRVSATLCTVVNKESSK